MSVDSYQNHTTNTRTQMADKAEFVSQMRTLIREGKTDLDTVVEMITDGELQLHNDKALRVIIGLIARVYSDDILNMKYTKIGALRLTFKNKPDQPLTFEFHMFDKWDKIKMKIDKLRDSNGECAVCYEIKPSKKNEPTFFCPHCCEFLCIKCYSQFNEEGKEYSECPVCRQCLSTYIATYDLIQKLK